MIKFDQLISNKTIFDEIKKIYNCENIHDVFCHYHNLLKNDTNYDLKILNFKENLENNELTIRYFQFIEMITTIFDFQYYYKNQNISSDLMNILKEYKKNLNSKNGYYLRFNKRMIKTKIDNFNNFLSNVILLKNNKYKK